MKSEFLNALGMSFNNFKWAPSIDIFRGRNIVHINTPFVCLMVFFTLHLSDIVPIENFEQVLPRDDLAVGKNVSDVTVSLCLGYLNPGNLYL